MRFFIAMASHETNTFSPLPTGRREFAARDLRYGGELLEASRGTGTCRGGMIEAAEACDASGLSSSSLTRSPFARVRRPIFPLDPI